MTSHNPNFSPHDSAPQQPTELDYEADPLLRLERNNRSTRHAFIFFISIVVVTVVAAVVIWLASQAVGGPYCDRDATARLCDRTFQVIFALVPTAICMFGLFGGAWITYRKWKRRERWRPWIAVVWFIMPFTMGWVTSVGALLILGHGL